MMAPDPLDFLDIDHLLSDEERQIRDLVREWVRRQRPARASRAGSRRGSSRRRSRSSSVELGLLGMHLEGYGCLGANAVSYGLACLELEAGDSGFRSFVSVQGSLCMFPIWKFGSEEQKERWLPEDGDRRVDRLLRPHRARLRQRPEPHANERQARRRRVGPHRHEDVDHERLDRRRGDRLGADRRRHPRVHRSDRHAGFLGERHPPQAVAPRERDVRAGARRGAAARRRGACPVSPA